jgi:Tol biopolymer transport system component
MRRALMTTSGSTHRFRVLALLLGAALAVGLLLLVDTRPAGAAFPGTNGKIAFENYQADDEAEIFVMNPNGTGKTRLTNNPASDRYPDLSPDGKKIAFTSSRDGNSEIYTMDAADSNGDGNGDNLANITNNPNSADRHPAFSPDGTKIAFYSSASGTEGIYVMNSNGTGTPTLLTNSQTSFATGVFGPDGPPVFSPDGTKIAFLASDRGGGFEIWVTNSDDTGTPTQLTNYSSGTHFEFDFSPDGTRIVFVKWNDEKVSIFVMDAVDGDGDGNGDNPQRLTRKGQFHGVAFSPDGQKIAYDRDGRRGGIFRMNADGTNKTRITPRSHYSPSWGPLPPTPPI